MALEADRYVKELRGKEGCDFVIVSYHSGLGAENGILEFGKNTENQALRIIKNTSGIDMMITGHDHDNSYSDNKYPDKDGKQVTVVNGGSSELTKTEITATSKGDGTFNVAVTVPQKNIKLSTYADDVTLKAMIQPYADEASTYVNRVCGALDGEWDKRTNFYLEQTDTMDLINRSQINRGTYYLAQKYNTPEALAGLQAKYGKDYTTAVDFSATSVVVANNYTARAGQLSMKDIYKFYKYDNSLYILPLTGAQIKEVLEFVASERLDFKVSGGKVVFKTKGDSFTNPVFYGLDFSYDISKPAKQRVTILGFKNGRKFDASQTYNLAINNYHLSNGPFAQYKPADTVWSQTDDLGGGAVQDLISEYVGNASPGAIKPEKSNWKIEYTGEIVEEPIAPVKPVDSFDPVAAADFTGTYAKAMDIKTAATKTADETATVIGQIVYNYGGTGYHIMEDVIDNQIYGYLVYDKDKKNTYTIGDVIAVSGTVMNYNGLPEIKNITEVKVIRSLGEKFTIAPQVIKNVKDLNENYLNELVVLQDMTLGSEVKDETGTIQIFSKAPYPEGLKEGDKADIYAAVSVFSGTYQLRNNSSADYKAHTGIYDPVADSLFTTEKKLSEVYTMTKGDPVTIIGQVTDKYSTLMNAEGNKSNIILQDVMGGKPVGLVVYDSTNFADYKIGDVVKVTGTVGEYKGLIQVSVAKGGSKPEVLKVEVQFQPQKVTIAQLGEEYTSELIYIPEVTLGTYKGDGDTPLTDATGTINVAKSAEFPSGVKAGDVVGVTAVCSKKDATTSVLRVATSYGYTPKAAAGNPDGDTYKLPIFETTDVHGFLLDVSSGDASTYQYRMAYISDKVKDVRANGDALLFDGGDIYQGNPVSNLLMGESMIAAYDEMGYDAVALGNHEFDWDVTKLVDADGTMGSYNLSNPAGKLTGNSKIPVVCGNIYSADTGKRVNFTKDYTILTKQAKNAAGKVKTIKVGVYGYADDYSADIMAAKIAPYKIDETKLKDLQASAKALENAGTVDATILLSHAGAVKIAESLASDTAFDLVLGGHTHKDVKGVASNGVPYLQTKNQAQSYGYLDLCMDAKTKKITVENAATNAVYVSANKAMLFDTPENAKELDKEIIKISKIAVEQVAPVMNVELGTITEQVTKAPIGENIRSSTAGTWMTEIMNQATGAKVSITNAGGIRTEFTFDTPSRKLTAGDVYTIAPFCNLLPTYEITYESLKGILEYGLDKGTKLDFRIGGATAYFTEKAVSTLFVGSTLVYHGGEWKVDKNTKLIVSTNEYIATYGDSPFKELTSRESIAGTTAAIDNESFIAALKKEAAANNGALHVNTSATLVGESWDGVTIPKDYSDIANESGSGDAGGGNVIIILPTTPEVKPGKPEVSEKIEVAKTEVTTKASEGTLKKDGFFYSEEGKKLTKTIVKTESGEKYILDEEGKKYVSTMVVAANGTKFIVGDNGAVVTGEIIATNGAKYYTTKGTGKIVTNKLFKVNGNKYFATKSGELATGKIIGAASAKYYTSKVSGKVVTNKLFMLDGKKYFATKSGKLATSRWIKVGSKRYYCNKEGVVTKIK